MSAIPKPVFFLSTLASSHAAGDGQLVLQPGDGARLGTLGPGQVYALTAVIAPGLGETILANFRATGLSTDTLTGVAADAHSADTAVPAGTPLQVRLTPAWQEDVQDALDALGPGGAATSVQFNDAGSFGGFGTWDGSTFTVTGSLVVNTNALIRGILYFGGTAGAFVQSLGPAGNSWYLEFEDGKSYHDSASGHVFRGPAGAVGLAVTPAAVTIPSLTAAIPYADGSGVLSELAIGSGLSLTAGTLAATGGGGTTIGAAVTGGTADRVLYVDGSGNLADAHVQVKTVAAGSFAIGMTSGGTWTGTDTFTVTLGDIGIAPYIRFTPVGGYSLDISNTAAGPINLSGGTVVVTASTNKCFSAGENLGAYYAPSLTISPGTGWSGHVIRGASGQVYPLLIFQGISSTATTRDLGYLDAGFISNIDASFTGYVSLDAVDASGRRAGIKVQANGTAAADIVIAIANVRVAANDAAAAALSPPVPQGGLYRSGSQLMIRVT